MKQGSHLCLVAGEAGAIDLAIDPAWGGVAPASADHRRDHPAVEGLALVAHPHPLFGGTRDNKVVMTLARALTARGYHVLRPNFRGVGDSEGRYDEGRGEALDLQALVEACRSDTAPPWWPTAAGFAWPGRRSWVLAGFSFGAFVQTRVHQALQLQDAPLILVGVAVSRFPVARVPDDSLVIHGEQDDVVPLSEVFDWAREQNLPVVVVPGTGHFFHGCLVRLKSIVTNFILVRYNMRYASQRAGALNEGDRDD